MFTGATLPCEAEGIHRSLDFSSQPASVHSREFGINSTQNSRNWQNSGDQNQIIKYLYKSYLGDFCLHLRSENHSSGEEQSHP